MKGYRTICANLLMAVPVLTDVVLPILQSTQAQRVVPQDWLPWYSLAVLSLNIVLRYITTTPVFKSEEDT